jgi:hypothetical protein
MRLGLKLCIAAGCFGALTACPVDERELEGLNIGVSGSSGQAGAGNGGENDGGEGNSGSSGQGGTSQGGTGGTGDQGGTSGTSAQGGSAGSGGSSGDAGGPPTKCPDLDVNGVLDCDETLAVNATFDSDVLPWIGETAIVTKWHETDAHGITESGALSVENQTDQDQTGASLLAARQCIRVDGDAVYNFAVEVSVPSESENTQGGMILYFYEGAACTGNLADTPLVTNFVSAPEWTVAQKTYLTPASAESVMVRLVAQKMFRDPPRKVFYDNVLVRKVESVD